MEKVDSYSRMERDMKVGSDRIGRKDKVTTIT